MANPKMRCRLEKGYIQFNPFTDRVVGGDMRDDSPEILFQLSLWEAIVSSSG